MPPLVAAMLAAAFAENAAGRIIVLAPARRGRRALRPLLEGAAARGALILTRPVDPWAAIERAARGYVAGGETGFLALLAGRTVRCFAGACLLATRCLDPYRGTASAFEDILDILSLWRRVETANRGIAVCLGMSL